MIRRLLLAVLAVMLVLVIVDPICPLAFLFWAQTIPITDRLVPLFARLTPYPMQAGQWAIWTGATVIASLWGYGLWRWVRRA